MAENKIPKWKQRVLERERKKEEAALELAERKAQGNWKKNAKGELKAKLEHDAILQEIAFLEKQKEQKRLDKAQNVNRKLPDIDGGYIPVAPPKSLPLPNPSPGQLSQRGNISIGDIEINPQEIKKEAQGKFWESDNFKKLLTLVPEDLKRISAGVSGFPMMDGNRSVGKNVGPTLEDRRVSRELGLSPDFELTEMGAPEEKPRYVFVINPQTGQMQPQYINSSDQTADYIQQAKNDPSKNWWQRNVTPYLLQALNNISKPFGEGVEIGGKNVVIGGVWEKEQIYQEDPNSGQAFVNLLFNIGALVIDPDSLGRMLTSPFGSLEEQKLRNKETAKEFWKEWNNVKVAWATFKEAYNKDIEEGRIRSLYDRSTYKVRAQEDIQTQAEMDEQERQEALIRSQELDKQSEEAYRKALSATTDIYSEDMATVLRRESFQDALNIKIESIRERRRSDPNDAWGAATWSREPEKYEQFLENAALMELQLGRPLQVDEIRRLKDLHVNIWTEISFEVVFDFTNLLPLVGSVNDALKITGRAKKATNALLAPFAKYAELAADTKVGRFLGDINSHTFGLLNKQAVRSTAASIQNVVHNATERMLSAYKGNLTSLMKDMPEFQANILKLKQLSPLDAEKAYQEWVDSGRMLGAKNLSYNDFKKLMDIDFTFADAEKTWGSVMSDSIQKSKDAVIEQAKKDGITGDLEKYADDYIAKNPGLPLYGFSEYFSRSYIATHIIHKGSSLTDDTLSGWLSKISREFSASAERAINNKEWLNGALKKTEFDEFIIKLGARSPEFVRNGVYLVGSKFLESVVGLGQWIRGLWVSVVLTTPRWFITNFIDSAGRSLIYGGNVWDDFKTLRESLQKHFLEEVGVAPVVLGSSLSRSDLDFTSSVYTRLMFRGSQETGGKTGWGLMHYWGLEMDRLKTIKKSEIANAVSNGLLGDSQKEFQSVWNGFKTVPPATIKGKLNRKLAEMVETTGRFLRSAPGAVADFNTSIEFTLRTRMFHRNYFSMLKKLEPEFINKGTEHLPPFLKSLALRIWKESGGNSAKMSQLVDELIGTTKSTTGWSHMLPAEFEDIIKDMDVTAAVTFTSHVRNQVEEFLTSSVKRFGRNPTTDEIAAFMADTKGQLQDAMQAAMSQRQKIKELDSSINPKKRPVEDPDMSDFAGAAPDSRTAGIADALKTLEKRAFRKKSDVVDSYKTLAASMGDVKEIPGGAVLVSESGGKVSIEVGSDLMKRTTQEINEEIGNATIKSAVLSNKKLIEAAGLKTDEFEEAFIKFLKDPAAVENENRKAFLRIILVIENDDTMARVLQATKGIPSYKGAYASYLRHSEELYTYNRLKNPQIMRQTLQEQMDGVMSRNAMTMNSGIELSESSVRFMDEMREIGGDTLGTVSTWHDRVNVYRGAYKEFLWNQYPGYKFQKGEARREAWEISEKIIAEAYNRDMKYQDELLESIKADPEGTLEKIKIEINDLPSEYLKRQGVELMWDESKTSLIRVSIPMEGKMRTFLPGSGVNEFMSNVFFGGRGLGFQSPLIKLTADMDMTRQMTAAFSSAFGLSGKQSLAWSQVMMNHARKWSKITGQPKEAYLEKFGFQVIGGVFELDPKTVKELSPTAFIRNIDGEYTLYGTESRSLVSLTQEMSLPFYESLVEMSKFSEDSAASLKRINKFIEESTGQKVHGGKMTKEQMRKFSELFTDYIATGRTKDLTMKAPFEKLKDWMADEFSAVKGVDNVTENIPDDVYDALNSMFVQQQIKVNPSREHVMDSVLDGVMDDVDAAKASILADLGGKYGNLDDVPLNELRDSLKRIGRKLDEFKVALDKLDELNLAFDTWKMNRELKQFPKSALTDTDTFRNYLKNRINTEHTDVALGYERILYDLQSFEDAFLKNKKTAFPPLHKFEMSDGMKVFVRNQSESISNYESALQALDYLEDWLKQEKYLIPALSDESKAALLTWRDTAVRAKSELVSTLLEGGIVKDNYYKGAIATTNDIMLDYTQQSNLDQFMKSFFPFWMFPSRSLPFWVKTLATHPQIIAGYNKLKRFSRAQRVQEGAVTSQGRPLPSLDGYVRIPGTRLWVNPLAHISAKYVLDLIDADDDLYYQSQNNTDDIDPSSYVVREIMEKAPVVGLSLAPWTAWLMKKSFNISDDTLPKFPPHPMIPLIPRWRTLDTIDTLNKITLNGTPWADSLYPEASWHDAIVEREIIQDVYRQTRTLPEDEAYGVIVAARAALKERRGNPLWDATYKEITNKEALYSWGSFFTGLYPKEFSDGQADMYAIRNEKNMMISAMNNEFQANLFDLPIDHRERWNRYLELNETTEGELYRLYTMLNWVKNEEGQLVNDPIERAKYLKLALEDDYNQAMYFREMANLRKSRDRKLYDAIGIGGDYGSDLVKKIYEEYAEEVSRIEETYTYSYDRSWGTNKPVELIMEDIENIYFRKLIGSKPRWDENLTQEEYDARVSEWEKNLPIIAYAVFTNMRNRNDVKTIRAALKPQQVIPQEFWSSLLEKSTLEGIRHHEIKTDGILTALNKAWTEIYWNEYWEGASALSGSERDLFDADFAANRPPPTAEEIFAWVNAIYGNRFSRADIFRYVNGTDVLDVEQAMIARKGQIYQDKQKVWDYLSWLGPSKNYELMQEIQQELHSMGIRENIFDYWYFTSGNMYDNNPDELAKFLLALEKIYNEKGIRPPQSREQMVEYVEAQKENEAFREVMNEKLLKDERFMKAFDEKWKNYTFMESDEPRFEKPLDALFFLQASYFYKDNDRAYQKEWKENNPAEWNALLTYWSARRAYGNQNKMWSKYYLWKPIPEQFQQVTGLPYSPARKTPSAIQSEVDPGYVSTPVGTVITLPDEMKATVGTVLYQDIKDLYIKGKRLNESAVAFLENLESRHPEWDKPIQDILYNNNRP